MKDSFSNRFKAQVALEANSDTPIEQLSEHYSVAPEKIKQWAQEVKERAELLFINQDAKNQTEAIQNYAALLRTTLESSPNGILVTDLKQNILTYNQRCADMWDIPEQIIARGSMDDMIDHIIQLLANPARFEHTVEEMYAYPDKEINDVIAFKDGRFYERHSVPYRVEGETIGRVTNFVDITRYKHTEQKLTEINNLLQSINTNVNEGILRSTPDQGLIYVNDAFVKMFGYDSKEEVMRTDPSEFYANEGNRWSLIQKLKKEGQFSNAESLFQRKDGSTFWGLENCTLVERDNDVFIDGVVTNIDNRKKAEQELRKSEEKYRSILKNIEEGYFETDLEGNFTFFNSALVDMMQYSASEMVGMNNREYMSETESEKVFDTFNRVYRTDQSERVFDWELKCGDGSCIYVEASVTLRKNSRGEPIGFSGMVRDITERKQKQKQIQDSLREKEVLLGEIHHRVKNNLAVISGLLYLQADKTSDDAAQTALMQSQSRINSMAIIHELLYDNKTFASLNPREYIEQLVNHISANLALGKTDITTRIEAQNFDLEMSTAIPCALIINELITNAYKYAFRNKKEGVLVIAFEKQEDGAYRLEVADNGSGLPDGFNIEDPNEHSLGLSLVKTLTRQLNGTLSTKNGSGARFIITFKG